MQKEYILNETTTRTSVNYGINNIKLNLEVPKINDTYEFENLSLETEELDKISIKIDDNIGELKNKIGISLNKYKKIEIGIPDNTILTKPISLEFEFDDDNNNLEDNIIIKAGKNSKADIFIYYSTINENNNDEKSNFHILKQESFLEENSLINVTVSNMLSENDYSFLSFENNLNENSKLNHTIIDLGGTNKISNYHTKLLGDCSENNVKNIYLGFKNDIIDIFYNIEAIGKKTRCDIEVEGAIKDFAKKNFKGIIDFKENSKASKGNENERCLILSENARSKSLPILLCHEEDVEGNHGVSSGKPDENKLFYLMTKGISYNDARNLLVKANLNRIINTIDSEELKKDIYQKIERMI